MRKAGILLAAMVLVPGAATARAHELWLQVDAGAGAGVARLTFGDTPDLAAAERVAEIARARVWADGHSLEVTRLPDGLEARLPGRRPALVGAVADRGVVKHRSATVRIVLAAYAQTRAIEPDQAAGAGPDEGQLRLLLVARPDGPPVVRATRSGKPVADAPVKIFHGTAEPAEARTDSRGEVSCPDLREGPWSLLVHDVDRTPGQLDGRAYTEFRHDATLYLSAEAGFGPAVAACLARVQEVHGGTGPWAVAGYRMGERALRELGLPRQSHALEVVHRCPAEVQYSCIADGVQAATGASPGKLNLRVETVARSDLRTVIRDRKSGRTLVFTMNPELARSITNLPFNRLSDEGRRVALLPDDAIFIMSESK